MTRPLPLFASLLSFASGSSSGSAPSDHTVSTGGDAHKPGYDNPTANCASCHGANLEGGTGPSFTDCHGKKW